jgi:hypothetical protein
MKNSNARCAIFIFPLISLLFYLPAYPCAFPTVKKNQKKEIGPVWGIHLIVTNTPSTKKQRKALMLAHHFVSCLLFVAVPSL